MINNALENIRVVDLSSYIAGAFGPTFLADLGANVIKVEAPSGDPFRMISGAFQTWNRGKRSIVVDLRKDEGKEIVYKLVEGADVVAQNYRPSVAEKLGVDYEALRRIQPDLIYCSVSGFGQTGPYSSKPGFDPLLQAKSGAMVHQGGPGKPPVFLQAAISDYSAALLSAFGMATALVARARTSRGQKLETSLLNATMAAQADRFILTSAKTKETPRMDLLGLNATYRLYQAADGWIFLGVRNEVEWSGLVRAVNRKELNRDLRFDTEDKRLQSVGELAGILEKVFASDTSFHWLDRLKREGVPCSSVNLSMNLFDHPHLLENDLIIEHHYSDIGTLKYMGVPVKFSKTPGIIRRPAPELGEHTDEVLAEIGYSPDEIKALKQNRIVK